MGKEASLWTTVREILSPFAHLERVENKVNVGTPDVNYCLNGAKGEGWLELKDVDHWPARAGTILRIAHVTEVQREWWRARRRSGGACYVLLRVGRSYLCFDGEVAARYLGVSDRAELEREALWVRGPDAPKLMLLQQLTRLVK